jgi:hypothetical protein
MKLLVTIGLIIILSPVLSQTNGLGRLEIWGWNAEIEDFRDLYLEKTGVDLAKSYACAAELSKMGYKNSSSIIYPDDIQAFLTGQINWETTDRLVIIREFPTTRFTEILKDTILQSDIEQLLNRLKNDQTLLNLQSQIKGFTNLDLILIGTTTPLNIPLRDNCNAICREIESDSFDIQRNTAEILTAMLSTPDPATFYTAIKFIRDYKDRSYIENELNLKMALTLKDFLSSNLQTFQDDAVDFLTSLYPDRENWMVKDWKAWLEQDE